jgi:hypothetical protein
LTEQNYSVGVGGGNMNDIVNLISTCGFPIACCVFMLYQNSKQDQYFMEQQEKLRESIENNTRTINELCLLINELKKG